MNHSTRAFVGMTWGCDRLARMITFGLAAAAAVLLTGVVSGCGTAGVDGKGPAPSLAGTWTASDGSSAKVFSEDGSCENAYYNDGKPLDIGGPMSCHLSSAADSNGRYKLMVTQGPNRATYLVEFRGDDAADVLEPNGTLLYSLSRF